MKSKTQMLVQVNLTMLLGLGAASAQVQQAWVVPVTGPAPPLSPLPAGLADSAMAPSVIRCLADCDAGTVTVTFNKPVQLDGNYSLDNGAFVWGQGYGASTSKLVLTNSTFLPGRTYTLSVTGVHDLESPANVLVPNPTVWSVACVSPCGSLTSRVGLGGSVIIEWNSPAGSLETSTDLLAWSSVANATSPHFVTPFPQSARFYRLRCADGSGSEPAIVRNPDSLAVNAGATVRFSAATTGAALSFQWFFNGTNLAGATNSILRLTGVSNAQVGVYELRVTNTFGAVTSAPAYLVLNNNTEGLPFNSTMAEPPAAVLLLSSRNPPDFPLNTTMTKPPVRTLLISSQKPPDFPLNTTVAQPPVATLLLSSRVADSPLNTTVAAPPVKTLLISSQSPRDFPLNTTVTQPPVAALLLSSQNPPDFPLNTTVAEPPTTILIGTNQAAGSSVSGVGAQPVMSAHFPSH